ncbi:hypothetical protein B484DRAFT_77718 [Ochromonadaceae sp. CCMP2298]|nr:hypothetical protein B484DRAFT_77718 [Ochromonadaceae sp. CCMP2298]
MAIAAGRRLADRLFGNMPQVSGFIVIRPHISVGLLHLIPLCGWVYCTLFPYVGGFYALYTPVDVGFNPLITPSIYTTNALNPQCVVY